jgi:hypothetical protein
MFGVEPKLLCKQFVRPFNKKSILHHIDSFRSCERLSFSCHPLGKNKHESSVYRVRCTVSQPDGQTDWSVILKILKPNSRRDSSDHYYWKREALVYRSGLLYQLPAGIKAPTCYAIEEQANGDVWLWLEDLELDKVRIDWGLRQMKDVSYLLGTFNGCYLTDMKSWIDVCCSQAKPMNEQQAIWHRYLDEGDHG